MTPTDLEGIAVNVFGPEDVLILASGAVENLDGSSRDVIAVIASGGLTRRRLDGRVEQLLAGLYFARSGFCSCR